VSGEQATAAAATQKLDEALALLEASDTSLYTSPVGGVGGHVLYTHAWAKWMRADNLAQFDAATAEYQAIPQQFPAALLAIPRTDWSTIRFVIPQ